MHDREKKRMVSEKVLASVRLKEVASKIESNYKLELKEIRNKVK